MGQPIRIDVQKQSMQDLKQHILLRADKIPVALALAQAAVDQVGAHQDLPYRAMRSSDNGRGKNGRIKTAAGQ